MLLMTKAIELVTNEARKNWRFKNMGHEITINCPFHQGRGATCHINLTSPRVPVGFFNCFSCPAKGPWNVLAEKCGWAKLPQDQQNEITGLADNALELMGSLRDSLLRDTTAEDDWSAVDPIFGSTRLLPLVGDWRDIPKATLELIGAQRYLHVQSEGGVTMYALPVKVDGRLAGIIKARATKHKTYSSYINSPGGWVETYGLFPLDAAMALPAYLEHGWIILVEGPRDALWLIAHGIPAVAILGSKLWNSEKRDVLLNLGVTKIASLYDNDAAGDMVAATTRKSLDGRCEYRRIRLPSEEKLGRKLDPAMLTAKQIKKLWAKLTG